MVCGCISSKGLGELALIDITMDAQQYLNTLKTNLKRSTNKNRILCKKTRFKFYQDNDPKHR